MEKFLSEALSESIKEDSVDTLADVLEIGVDSFLDDGLAKDFPLLSTVVGIYNVGKSINDLYLLKKLKVFVCAINDGIATEQDRQKYKERILHDKAKHHKELEFILILINRYISFNKPEMLAKLFLAYIDEKISWVEFTKYSEVIDRFLSGDCNMLLSSKTFRTERDVDTDSIQRLIALGLVVEGFRPSLIMTEEGTLTIDPPELLDKRERNYNRTEFGDKLAGILSDELER